MIVQKSTSQEHSTLYLVPTPIGNLLDMTPRAVEVLSRVDYIFAEDTRVTKIILSHFNIQTKLKSYHLFNEEEVSNDIISLLKEGLNIAIVSDAGMPGISDPGYLIASKALKEGLNVVSLPGANAALTALVASGIPCEKFYFYGFLKHKVTQKEKELQDLVDFKNTIIFYESPHRINETINLMYKVFGNRNVVIARELTKKYEEYIRGNLEELANIDLELKGEIVIIVSGADIDSKVSSLNDLDIKDHFNHYVALGMDAKEAMKKVAKDRGTPKSEIYKIINIK
jgi:16S rRNA (cytidine1402-2'-O)-methyltransferase